MIKYGDNADFIASNAEFVQNPNSPYLHKPQTTPEINLLFKAYSRLGGDALSFSDIVAYACFYQFSDISRFITGIYEIHKVFKEHHQKELDKQTRNNKSLSKSSKRR